MCACVFQIAWPKKLFLAHGIVRGMEYLHSIQPHPVIHGDLKIQNVLVGDGLVAKVCMIVKLHIKVIYLIKSTLFQICFICILGQNRGLV